MSANPVSIADTIVYGVAFDPKNSARVARMDLNELNASVGRLFDLLEERDIDFVLAGGIAMLAYVEGRNTQDIDLVIHEESLKKLPELRVNERNKDFGRSTFGELQVDLLFADNEPFRTVSQHYVGERKFAERMVPCATEIGMLVMKLFALPALYRQAQFDRVDIYRGDLAGLIRRGAKPSATTWELLSQNLIDSDVEELRRIVTEIEAQITRESSAFGKGPAT